MAEEIKTPENNEEIEARLRAIKRRLLEPSFFRDLVKERIDEHVEKIRGKHPDRSKYVLWHVLSGSTEGQFEPPTEFDFPEEYLSVKKFLEELDTEFP